ncbi:hypothetical protein [Mesorhizobium humile]|uniref:Uncharacterized protein n=1 Tax=Mesorhizobium humile TaxID=3072313 RepID=A0ABU4YQ24_9HYPH|nr:MULTISPECIES: hypothetical protein [unclassified Mesorhizobium]MDX8463263.1 hypothetical protein [Mesorhizobium sp. VK2D]MDX8488393.1 hypothetical protein [Mesorhizobium sp. VK2B]
MSGATSRADGRQTECPRLCRTRLRAAEIQDELFVRTIDIARARIKIGMANLAYNLSTAPSGPSLITA